MLIHSSLRRFGRRFRKVDPLCTFRRRLIKLITAKGYESQV